MNINIPDEVNLVPFELSKKGKVKKFQVLDDGVRYYSQKRMDLLTWVISDLKNEHQEYVATLLKNIDKHKVLTFDKLPITNTLLTFDELTRIYALGGVQAVANSAIEFYVKNLHYIADHSDEVF